MNNKNKIALAKILNTMLITIIALFAFVSSAHANVYLCANKNKQGNLGPNAVKVTVNAKSLKQAIPRARKAMKNKGYKVKKVACTPTQSNTTKAKSGANYVCGNLNKNGKIGVNSIKISVKANTKRKAIARAKKSYIKKGYKVRKMACSPM
jgi:hypothetical protein